jgi:alpha-1,3-fucosyltransferase
MAFWLVSHCETGINREGYVTELQKHLQVDIFGRCGKEDCTKKGNECFEKLSMNYLFYIAFENSICDDYATEKFFRTLMYPVIPVVMGGADYKAIAPPHSYIDVNDFKTVKQLAEHLIRLSKNLVTFYKNKTENHFSPYPRYVSICIRC